MPRNRVPRLGDVVIAGWIREDLAKQGITDPKLFAIRDESDPTKYSPFILLKDNGDNTVNGFTFPPEIIPDRPPYGIESLPNVGGIPADRLSTKPNQRVFA